MIALSEEQQKEQSKKVQARGLQIFIHKNSRHLKKDTSDSGKKALEALKKELTAEWKGGARDSKDVMGTDADQADQIEALKKKITALTARATKAENKTEDVIANSNSTDTGVANNEEAVKRLNTLLGVISENIIKINGRLTILENPPA